MVVAAAAYDDDGDYESDDVDRPSPLFAVDADTGVVTAVASLDRESAPQHRFQVKRTICVEKTLSFTFIFTV